MNKFTGGDLQELMDLEVDWAVSLFMSTHRAGPETRQDPIRFKNLLRMAEHAMKNRHVGNGAAAALAPAEKLVGNNHFWQHQSDGLAVFIGKDFFKYYTLPFHFPENVLVDDRFHIKPLLPVHYGNGRFYLLTLSQKRVRIFLCTRDEIEEIQVVGVPTSIEEYMSFVEETTGRDQRPPTPRGGSGGGGVPTVHNSHGTGDDRGKQRILEFFREVDKGLHDLLHDEVAPLVVGCVDYLFPIYEEANNYNHLVPQPIVSNPEALTTRELKKRAWDLLQPSFRLLQDQAIAQYHQIEGSERASRKLKEIVAGAHSARVETLLVSADQEVWGVFNPETQEVHETKSVPAEAEELINLATVFTLKNGGNVYVLPNDEMPHGAPMVAIFRY